VKLLVTGATGFVGRYMMQRLPSAIAVGPEMDLRSTESIARTLDAHEFDSVLHLAAQSSVPASFENPTDTFDINFTGTHRLLELLNKRKFKGRFLFVGSGDMYGPITPEDLPVRESRSLKPLNPYSVSKVAAEALCYQMSQSGPLDIVMARPFNHIGPGQSEHFAVSSFAKQIVEIKRAKRPPMIQVGNLESTRDFSDVRDVVEAYLLLLEKGVSGEVYNICSERERSLQEIFDRLQHIAGIRCDFVIDKSRLRPTDSPRVRGSAEKIHEQTGWKPAIDFDQSLRDLIHDWEARLR
jgi:GDP-4-dehydro-6-deoxy-D-mannose reductase